MQTDLYISKDLLLERLKIEEASFLNLLKTFSIDVITILFSQKQVDFFISYLQKTNQNCSKVVFSEDDFVTLDHIEKQENLVEILEKRKKVSCKSHKNPATKLVPLKECRPHQEDAKNDILLEFTKSNRCKFISACGTGKTLTSQRVMESIIQEKEASCSLILLPTLDLIIQFFASIRSNTKVKSHQHPLIICSDLEILNSDEYIGNKTSLKFNTESSLLRIVDFLQNKQTHKLILCTYQSAKLLGEAITLLPKNFSIDFAIFDEAHKTAGEWNKEFSYALYDDNIKISKRLFMTATSKENILENNSLLGMDNVSIYGNIAHELTMDKAIQENIIKDYKIIIGVINKKKIEKIYKNADSSIYLSFALKEMLKLAPINKGIVFHNTINESLQFVESLKKYGQLESHEFIHIDGTMPTKKRKSILQKLTSEKRTILSNSRLLSEGVDTPSIEMVGLFSTSKSVIDIAQRIGRAQRKNDINDTKPGYVFLPLVVEEDIDLTKESFSEKSNLSDVLDVIDCIKEIDCRVKMNIQNLFYDQKRGALENHIEIKSGEFSLSLIEESILDGIKSSYYSPLKNRWDINLLKLKSFIEQNKRMPKGTVVEEMSLFEWGIKNKKLRKKGLLSEEKIEKLDAIGFIWCIFDVKWENYFEKFVAFVNKHKREPKGSSKKKEMLPEEREENLIALWVSNQKAAYAKNLLDSERYERLTPYISTWLPKLHTLWLSQCEKFEKFILENNRFPKDVFENCEEKYVYRWILMQRRLFKNGNLDASYKSMLDNIYADWTLPDCDRFWKTQLAKFLTFITEKKRLPRYIQKDKYEHNIYLWITKQKKALELGSLNNWQEDLLRPILANQDILC